MGEIACALQSEYEPREGYLFARVTGDPVMEALTQSATEALRHARALGLKAILVDATGLTGSLGVMERFQFGLHFAVHWDLTVRVALVIPPETLPERRFLENVARNRAVPVRLFGDFDEALAWLRSAPAAPPAEGPGGEGP